MKLWKIMLVASALFAVVITAFVYSSCVKDSCDGLTCFNGGACGGGVCNCPTGYEGTQCQTLSISRFVGTYAGFISCNSQQQVIDSAFITADDSSAGSVFVKVNSISPKVLIGYVSNNESVYSIIVTNNDSFSADPSTLFYERLFTITLQNDNSLSIHSYEDSIFHTASGLDTVVTSCAYLGTAVH